MSARVMAAHTPGLSEMSFDGAPGAFDTVVEPSGQRRFWFVCPGCCVLCAIALRPVIDGSPQSWELSGAMDAPTLQPSINHVGCWHGWLTRGEFTSC